MIKVMIAVSFLCLSACVPTIASPQAVIEIGNPHEDVIYIGDSLCAGKYLSGGLTAQEQAGIGRDCKAGRKLVEYGALPAGYRVIFLALVTNDVGRTPIDTYRADLQGKLLSTNATVYCVLPTSPIGGADSSAYRAVMLEECANTIDPYQYGVDQGFTADGYHWGLVAHINFVPAITERI